MRTAVAVKPVHPSEVGSEMTLLKHASCLWDMIFLPHLFLQLCESMSNSVIEEGFRKIKASFSLFLFFYVKLAGTFSRMFRKHNAGIMLSSTHRMCSNLSSTAAFSYTPSMLKNIYTYNMESTPLKLIGSLQTPLKRTTILYLRKLRICSYYNCESYTAYNTCIFVGKWSFSCCSRLFENSTKCSRLFENWTKCQCAPVLELQVATFRLKKKQPLCEFGSFSRLICTRHTQNIRHIVFFFFSRGWSIGALICEQCYFRAMLHYIGSSWCEHSHVHSPQDASREGDATQVSRIYLPTHCLHNWTLHCSTSNSSLKLTFYFYLTYRWSSHEVLFRNLILEQYLLRAFSLDR